MAAVHVKTVLSPGSAANEVVAASVVYLQRVRTDGPMSQVTCLPDWNGAYVFAKLACRAGALLEPRCSRCTVSLSLPLHVQAGGVEQRSAPAPLQRRAQAGQPALPRRCWLRLACNLRILVAPEVAAMGGQWKRRPTLPI